MRFLKWFVLTFCVLLAAPAVAQNVKVVDPATGLQCFSAANPCTVKSGGSGTAADQVQGSSASAATDDNSNPVKMGCVYVASPATMADGQRSNVLCSTRGYLYSTLTATNGTAYDVATLSDAITSPTRLLSTIAFNALWNGSTSERARSILAVDGTGLGVTATATAPQSSATGAITPVVGSLVNGIVGKASAGNLYEVEIVTGAAAGYIYVFNSTTVPSDGAVTAGTASGNYQFCQPVAATTGARFSYTIPERYSVGISTAVSSTACGTLTKIATSVFLKVRAQ